MHQIYYILFLALLLCSGAVSYGFQRKLRDTSAPEVSYGSYCGKDHYNNYGAIPIDDFDRVCQIHDICVTAKGMLDCYCNEQLYWMLSYLQPRTTEQSQMKDQALRGIYASIFGCTNYYSFDTEYYISKMMEPNVINTYKGFNYLPIYYSFDGTICTDINTLIVFYTDVGSYYNITKAAFNDPPSVIKYPHSVIQMNSCIRVSSTDKILILYNILNVPRKITYLIDTCHDGRWSPRSIN